MLYSMRKLSQYQNLIYIPQFVKSSQKTEILNYLNQIQPIWEMRYSNSNPPPEGETNRPLLRPVYWLGNWQFACLNYYHPPQGIRYRCVHAEPYPKVLKDLVEQAEQLVRQNFLPKDVPENWHLNTCLINFYGNKQLSDKTTIDCARVGEHKDFEPGPVASFSFGERALIQFVKSSGKSQKSDVVLQQWLEDSSLQIFGGDKFKKQLFHRVQRVEEKGIKFSKLNTTNFETRRINFTFRYVPTEHIKPFTKLPENLQNDVLGYVNELSNKSDFWKDQLN